ncbi:MAG: hypothetical protein J0I06_17325 [Planctomycetes bacterium]|nr:hypothetical protein [Planctomycetota bacterium]
MSQSSNSKVHRAPRLSVECLEDRITPVFLTQPQALTGGLPGFSTVNGVSQNTGGLSIAAGDLYPDNVPNQAGAFVENEFVVGFGPGPESQVGIFGRDGKLRGSFTPFPGFTGGVNVAVGDVLGDSRAEIIVTPASNALPIVAVFTPQGRLLSAFMVMTPLYTGGLNVAVGNVLGGIGAGGYNGGFTREEQDAYQSLFGVNVSNQFKQEIIVGTSTLSSRVVVTDGVGNVQRDFFAFDPLYNGGVTLTAASVDKRRDPGFTFQAGQEDTASYDEIIVGAASQAPLVRVYDVWQGGANLTQNFFAFPATIGMGVNVAAGPSDFIRGAEIYVNLLGTSIIRTFDGETQEQLAQTQVFPPQYSHGLNMATGFFSNTTAFPAGTTVPPSGFYDPTDDSTFFNNFGVDNPDFLIQDLVVVSADGPFFQQPRLYTGGLNPAPLNGP